MSFVWKISLLFRVGSSAHHLHTAPSVLLLAISSTRRLHSCDSVRSCFHHPEGYLTKLLRDGKTHCLKANFPKNAVHVMSQGKNCFVVFPVPETQSCSFLHIYFITLIPPSRHPILASFIILVHFICISLSTSGLALRDMIHAFHQI
jgi:hypothetical protein